MECGAVGRTWADILRPRLGALLARPASAAPLLLHAFLSSTTIAACPPFSSPDISVHAYPARLLLRRRPQPPPPPITLTPFGVCPSPDAPSPFRRPHPRFRFTLISAPPCPTYPPPPTRAPATHHGRPVAPAHLLELVLDGGLQKGARSLVCTAGTGTRWRVRVSLQLLTVTLRAQGIAENTEIAQFIRVSVSIPLAP